MQRVLHEQRAAAHDVRHAQAIELGREVMHGLRGDHHDGDVAVARPARLPRVRIGDGELAGFDQVPQVVRERFALEIARLLDR